MSKQAKLADGTILNFPDDTPDDVMDAAVKKHLGIGATQPSPAPAPAPAAQRSGFSDDRTTLGVAADQAWANVKGAVMAIPGALGGALQAAKYRLQNPNPLLGVPMPDEAQFYGQAAQGAVQPFTTSARGLGALLAPDSIQAPTPEEFTQAGEAAGANAAMTALPLLGSKIKALPETLMTRAAGARAAVQKMPPATVPLSKGDALIQATKAVARPVVNRAATIAEATARGLDKFRTAPDVNIPPSAAPGEALPFQEPYPGYARESAPVDLKTPTTPSGELPFTPTPEAPFETYKTPVQRGADLPFEMPAEQPFETFKQPVTRGADLPFEAPPELTNPTPAPVDLTRLEQNIAPTGMRQRLSTLRNAPKLAEEAPELSQVSKLQFDPKLYFKFKGSEIGVIQAEDAVPRTVTVPKAPIVEHMDNLAAQYLERDMPKSAAAVEKAATRWKELPDLIPWEDFVKRKRGFFREAGPNSAPLKKAYSVLIESANKVSPELAKRNATYSILRRAMDDAGIDTLTGRRIREVGKQPTVKGLPQ